MRNLNSPRLLAKRPLTVAAGIALAGFPLLAGCQEENPPHAGTTRSGPIEGRIVRDPVKPLPEPMRDELPPPYVDVPLVNQQLPEERDFLRAYNGVRRPRIAVFVNRTLQGELIPAGDGREHPERTDRVVTRGPYGAYSEHTDTYLRPGEYDEAWAKAIDYAAIETALTEWLSADHQVTIVSPATVRSRLTDAEIARLQDGRPRLLGDLARNLDADILVQVQARPTRQVPRGTSGVGIRLIAEAVNVAHGESIARARTTFPPPLDGPVINDYTRFLARKLMSDMVATWSGPGPLPAAAEDRPPPQAAPAVPAPPAGELAPRSSQPPDAGTLPPPAPATITPPAPPATGGTDIPTTPAPPASTPRTLDPYDLPEVKPGTAGAADARLAPAPAAQGGELVAPVPAPPRTQPVKIDLDRGAPSDAVPDGTAKGASDPPAETPANKPGGGGNDPFTK